jgi:hypothetical protein
MEQTTKYSIYGVLTAFLGGGGYATYDAVKAHAIEEGNKVWVTLASQNVDTRFAIQDELAAIQRKITKGQETTDDLIRKAVLEERLKQLEKYE